LGLLAREPAKPSRPLRVQRAPLSYKPSPPRAPARGARASPGCEADLRGACVSKEGRCVGSPESSSEPPVG
jgi:hypothetical protein